MYKRQGGIYTGEDIYRIMELGADGVQMGTRCVTTEECDASTEFKRSYIEASQQDIEIIQSPVGMPGRAPTGCKATPAPSGSCWKSTGCRYFCL